MPIKRTGPMPSTSSVSARRRRVTLWKSVGALATGASGRAGVGVAAAVAAGNTGGGSLRTMPRATIKPMAKPATSATAT